MKVVNHRLVLDGAELDYRSSPNTRGELIGPRAIVMHFTAGRSFEKSCDWLCNPQSKASAHVVIGREGEIAQLVPFDKRAWHAGDSKWTFDKVDVSGLNAYSIGIELDNFGHLQRRANGWHTYWGAAVPDDDVMIALDGTGWHAYTEQQIDRALEVCTALVQAYRSVGELLGHSDIAPKRKHDPGPAFPMITIRSQLFGRSGEGEA
jgi:N-acetylmuramoyl-L-alanine amidase